MVDSPRGRRRSRFQLLAACAVLVLLLAACANTGEPTEYGDTVSENFTDGCEKAAEDDPVIRPAAVSYCACAYERLAGEISFEDFKKLDDDVREAPEKIRNDDEESTATHLEAIFADCRATHGRG